MNEKKIDLLICGKPVEKLILQHDPDLLPGLLPEVTGIVALMITRSEKPYGYVVGRYIRAFDFINGVPWGTIDKILKAHLRSRDITEPPTIYLCWLVRKVMEDLGIENGIPFEERS